MALDSSMLLRENIDKMMSYDLFEFEKYCGRLVHGHDATAAGRTTERKL